MILINKIFENDQKLRRLPKNFLIEGNTLCILVMTCFYSIYQSIPLNKILDWFTTATNLQNISFKYFICFPDFLNLRDLLPVIITFIVVGNSKDRRHNVTKRFLQISETFSCAMMTNIVNEIQNMKHMRKLLLFVGNPVKLCKNNLADYYPKCMCLRNIIY